MAGRDADKDRKKSGRYRWRAFSHWLNLGFLAASGAAVVVLGPIALIPALAVEAGALWVVPDLPPFRRSVNEQLEYKDVLVERAYYLHQLWGLRPPARRSFGAKLAGLFAETVTDDLDDRIERLDTRAAEYLELRRTVRKLRELRELRDVKLHEHELARLELVINGYLRLQVAARVLAKAVSNLDETKLRRELQEVVEQLEGVGKGELRAVLTERKRLCDARLARLPKLVATLELFRTRAETIVNQMRNIHSQVLADPGTNVTAYLGDLVERHEILVDPLGTLEAEHLLDDLVEPGAAVRQAAASAAIKR